MRKRMLNPTIWFNTDVSKLKLSQRLIYIGLISLSDDDGRLIGDPAYIKAQLFPYDHIPYHAVKSSLQRIADENLIIHYEVSGSWYIQHPRWTKHQYIRDRKPSQYPPPPKKPSTVTPPNPNQSKSIQIKSICDDLLKRFYFTENDQKDWCYGHKRIKRCEFNRCNAELMEIKKDVDARKETIKNYAGYFRTTVRSRLLSAQSAFVEAKHQQTKKEEASWL